MSSRGKPVAVAANIIREVGNRPRVQNAESVRPSPVCWNDVGRKATIGIVVARGDDLATLRSGGRLRIPDEHRYLVAGRIGARDERIIRVQQLAEIALAH